MWHSSLMRKTHFFFFLTLTCCQVECLRRLVTGYITSVFQKYTAFGRAAWTGPGEGHSARSKCPFSVLHHSAKNYFEPGKVEEHIDWFFVNPLNKKKKKKILLVISEFSLNNATEGNDIFVSIAALVCCLKAKKIYKFYHWSKFSRLLKFILLDDLKI